MTHFCSIVFLTYKGEGCTAFLVVHSERNLPAGFVQDLPHNLVKGDRGLGLARNCQPGRIPRSGSLDNNNLNQKSLHLGSEYQTFKYL